MEAGQDDIANRDFHRHRWHFRSRGGVTGVTVSPVDKSSFAVNPKNTPPPKAVSVGHFISDDTGDSGDILTQWVGVTVSPVDETIFTMNQKKYPTS